jgi:hypothetical protein
VLSLADVETIPQGPRLVIQISVTISYPTSCHHLLTDNAQKILELQNSPFPILREDETIVQECLDMVIHLGSAMGGQ